jgi:hypothetical protein
MQPPSVAYCLGQSVAALGPIFDVTTNTFLRLLPAGRPVLRGARASVPVASIIARVSNSCGGHNPVHDRRLNGALLMSAAMHALVVLAFACRVPVAGHIAVAPVSALVRVVVESPEDSSFVGLKPLKSTNRFPAFDKPYQRLTFKDAKFDLAAIATRARVLFPFVSPGLALEPFGLSSDHSLPWIQAVSAFTSKPILDLPPLQLRPAAMQAVIDRTWSRHDRWAAVEPIVHLLRRTTQTTGSYRDCCVSTINRTSGSFSKIERPSARISDFGRN